MTKSDTSTHWDDDGMSTSLSAETADFWKGQCCILRELLEEKEATLSSRTLEVADLKAKLDAKTNVHDDEGKEQFKSHLNKWKSESEKKLVNELIQTKNECQVFKNCFDEAKANECEQLKIELIQSRNECQAFKDSFDETSAECEQLKIDLGKSKKECESFKDCFNKARAECEQVKNDLKQAKTEFEELSALPKLHLSCDENRLDDKSSQFEEYLQEANSNCFWRSTTTKFAEGSSQSLDILSGVAMTKGKYVWKLHMHKVCFKVGMVSASHMQFGSNGLGFAPGTWGYYQSGDAWTRRIKIGGKNIGYKGGSVVTLILDLTNHSHNGTLSVSVDDSPVIQLFSNILSNFDSKGLYPAVEHNRISSNSKVEFLGFE